MKLPIIFGHRGASSEHPENTMKAFKQAFIEGALGIEFDVRFSADNEIVIIHDELINRTSDGIGKVNSLTLKELRNFDFGLGEKIPTLKEVLLEFGNKFWLNIEIKEVGLEEQLVRLLSQNKISEKFVVSSFYGEVLNKIKEISSKIPTAFLYDFPINNLDELTNEIQIDGIHPGKNQINQKLIDQAHERSLSVRGWTIDEIDLAINFTSINIDGIITNTPKIIINALKTKK
ncbi:MAG: glycerophosphodiester phosphodiesterase [Candidatus Heimdallarchaeota archaeon]|nr:glycerophosphodiester phosphodiesterase [Candidatus Heimdallarchaeota archaeon]